MKKTIITLSIVLTAMFSFAQSAAPSQSTETTLFTLNALAVLLVLFICCHFVLSLIRIFLDNRLKKKLLDQQASTEMASLLLPTPGDLGQQALKWSLVLAGIATGSLVCYFTQPLGLHSVAILSAAVAIALLVFYSLTRQKK